MVAHLVLCYLESVFCKHEPIWRHAINFSVAPARMILPGKVRSAYSQLSRHTAMDTDYGKRIEATVRFLFGDHQKIPDHIINNLRSFSNRGTQFLRLTGQFLMLWVLTFNYNESVAMKAEVRQCSSDYIIRQGTNISVHQLRSFFDKAVGPQYFRYRVFYLYLISTLVRISLLSVY